MYNHLHVRNDWDLFIFMNRGPGSVQQRELNEHLG